MLGGVGLVPGTGLTPGAGLVLMGGEDLKKKNEAMD